MNLSDASVGRWKPAHRQAFRDADSFWKTTSLILHNGGMRLLAVLVASALAVTSAVAADHADPVISTGTKIPGTLRTVNQVSQVRHDGDLTVFEMSTDLGDVGFGVAHGSPDPDPLTIEFHPLSPRTSMKKASLSSPAHVFLASDAGVPTIFGVLDVDSWNPVAVLAVNDDLPGGHKVSGLGAFHLAGKKLVIHAKKAVGEGIYGIADFTSPDPFLMLETGQGLNVGDITGFGDVSTDGQFVAVHAVADFGEALLIADDFGTASFEEAYDTNTPMPNAAENFAGFGQVEWTAKKLTFLASSNEDQGIYFGDGKGAPEAVIDTILPCPSDPTLFFTDFEGFALRNGTVAVVANGIDGSRGTYYEEVGKASRRVLAEGDVLVDGRKVDSFSMTNQAVGSLLVSAQLDDGAQSLVSAETAIPVPALPLLGLALLLVSGLSAVALAWRGARRRYA